MSRRKICRDNFQFDVCVEIDRCADLKKGGSVQQALSVLERVDSMRFWNYHYAVRAFFNNIEERKWFKDRYESGREFFKKVFYRHVGDDEEKLEDVIRMVVITYNYNKNANPRCSYIPFREEYIGGFPYKLHGVARRHVNFFVYIAFKYGYTFSFDLNRRCIVGEIEKIAKNNAYQFDTSSILRREFVKYQRRKNRLVIFNFIDLCGEEFFEPENAKNIYLYIDGERYCSARDNASKIRSTIKSWSKKRGFNPYEKNVETSIQAVINGDMIMGIDSEDELSKVIIRIDEEILHTVESYAVWRDRISRPSHHKIQTMKRVYIPPYEQATNGARAIGLWIWDLVNFEKISFADAARVVLSSNNHCRSKSENRKLYDDYDLARECIERCTVLNYSDLRRKKFSKCPILQRVQR